MSLLENVRSPHDLRQLSLDECAQLAIEIRDFLVTAVSRTGGHLGPNLGAVELTIALHRVFDSPRDRILFDTGHQAYVHKILTGRAERFETLRQPGGLSGYPSQAESEHDIIENSHASTALSYADGLAKAYHLRGESDRTVVAVVGDGALTGGMCWEALNNIAAGKDRPVVIVVNDNGRSYAPTIGGLAERLAALRTAQAYEQALAVMKKALANTPLVGPPLYDALHGIKAGLKDMLTPQALFADLGLKYLGPVDGHDVEAVENALRLARDFGGPVVVHAVTRKGFGYPPALADTADCLHSPGAFDVATGRAIASASGCSWTSVFADEICAIGATDPAVVAITAAMLEPVGLGPFAAAYPDRVFDVGIAEQHAVTSAAGLALGGLKPVVCVYSTFLNRAIDQVIMDVALHKLPVTFVLDRAGITGDDGPSHNGMWDLALLGVVPGLAVAAPRDPDTLRRELGEAVARPEPAVVRFPKGPAPADLPAVETLGESPYAPELLARGSRNDVLLIAVGALAATAVDVAGRCEQQGVGVTVVDPRWVAPLHPALIAETRKYGLVVTVEDGVVTGGVGSRVAQAMAAAGVARPPLVFGIPQRFLAQGKRPALLRELGLGAQELARSIIEAAAHATAARPATRPAENLR